MTIIIYFIIITFLRKTSYPRVAVSASLFICFLLCISEVVYLFSNCFYATLIQAINLNQASISAMNRLKSELSADSAPFAEVHSIPVVVALRGELQVQLLLDEARAQAYGESGSLLLLCFLLS